MKNPWMSLWLSGANAWMGAARGFWTAETHRRQAAMMNEAAKQMASLWTRGWAVPAARPKARDRG